MWPAESKKISMLLKCSIVTKNSDDNRKVKQVVEEQEQNQFKSALFGETFADFAIFGFFVKV